MAEAIPFPQDRTCPYHPPADYRAPAQQGPVHRVTLYDGHEAWLVTGHAEAQALLTDARLSSDRQRNDFPVVAPRFDQSRTRPTPLLGVDDPEHNRQRRMLIPAFGVKRIAALRPRIQLIVDGLLDDVLEKGPPSELVADFALPVPSMVICELLGVPYADHEFFESASRRLLRGRTAAEAEVGRDQLLDYLRDLIGKKERGAAEGAGEGILDQLIHGQLREGDLEREDLTWMALVLLVAGHETTANMISLGTFTLLEHPDQLAALRADPELLPGAVEELLRFLSIAEGLQRVAAEDIEVGGVTIRAGEGVMFATSTINRDDARYPDPDHLDVARSARHHVAFGFGVHQCLGQNLARVELEIALRTLFERIPDLRLAVPVAQVRHKPGDTLQGLVELPVAWGEL
ncbi:cytochrome P450 [Streptomyces sp. NPDC059009]|uniref:cytochrome P450 n=1 Tax=Streptomyces sp. NPDC059009 TaxID=3346694 RepID=UPI0036B4D9DB